MRIQRFHTWGGFVPIELLAILAVLLLFVGIALPAVANFQSRSAAAICLNNHKQIALAWASYANANDGACANNFTLPSTLNAITTGRLDNWANNVMTWGAGSSIEDRSVTNEAWAASGLLQTYASAGVEIYRCPSDHYLSAQQRQRGYKERLRSVSMNTVVGRPETTPGSLSGRSWAFGGAYRQWLKVHDIPNPKMTWLTIDEHPDSINDGFFVSDTAASSWMDIPGTLHSGATSFSFVDGHVESRKWRSASSRVPVRFTYTQPRPFDAAGREDFAWYVERSGLIRY